MATIDLEALRGGNRRALAKAITLTESTREADRDRAQIILDELLPYTGNSVRLGISGVPGVGKSTFIESLGLYLAGQGKRIAVLAVDPSSPVAGGSILGDKTRMEDLSKHDNAFIRPSPSSGALGGVAQKTRETMLLCEAAGFDVIIVETVGVGQSEYDVASMVDFFLVLMIPNAGDDLQGIKKGIMEMVDTLVINKADGDSVNLAKQSCQHYRNAFHLMRKNEFWSPQVLTCSALKQDNIDTVWSIVEEYVAKAKAQQRFNKKRVEQNLQWMKTLIYEAIELRMQSNETIRATRKQMEVAIIEGTVTPFAAAKTISSQL